MPKFFGAGVEVRLCTTSLEQTTTTDTDMSVPGKKSQEYLERVESQMTNATTLLERTIRDGEDGGIVRFLGATQTVPFYLVRAGHIREGEETRSLGTTPDMQNSLMTRSRAATHSDGSKKEQRDQNSAATYSINRTRPDFEALAITTNVPQSAFRPGSDGKPMDIRIDVFYNGEFAAYKLLPARSKLENSRAVFSGQRVHLMLERPWVLRDLDKGNKGLDPFRQSGSTHPNDRMSQRLHDREARWQQVGRSLYQEAIIRGVDKKNSALPITDYLTSLATCGFPVALANDTSPPLDAKMGIIDVVVSLGSGSKPINDTSYSYNSTRLPDPTYAGKMSVDLEVLSAIATPSLPINEPASRITSLSTLTGFSSSPRSGAGTSPNNGGEQTPHLRDSVVDINDRPRKAQRLETNISVPNVQESGRLSLSNSTSGIDPTQGTIPLAPPKIKLRLRARKKPETVDASTENLALLKSTPGIPILPKPTATSPSQNLSSPVTPTPTPSTAALAFRSQQLQPPSSFQSMHKFKLTANTPSPSKDTFTPSRSTNTSAPLAAADSSTRKRRPRAKARPAMLDSYDWTIPELSQDSVATYSSLRLLGQEDTEGLVKGMCRAVRKERSGNFEEDYVLMGVRFVVG